MYRLFRTVNRHHQCALQSIPDDHPETNFNTDGYLIGKRFHPNAQAFLANARALTAKAKADDLPGIGATQITALDAAIETITSHRIALQYAADRAYPPGDSLTAPSRKRIHFDPDKGLGGGT
jgi:hypothetical protein